MSETTPSIFETYNARHLAASRVADTFVPSAHFRKLCQGNNHVLVGPRGSGKTTLLKMLQIPALRSWSGPDALDFRSSVQFCCVFVPADVSWGKQLQNIGHGRLATEVQQQLTRAAYATHVLRALVDTFIERFAKCEGIAPDFLRLEPDRSLEAEVTRLIARLWLCSPEIPTFLSLKQTLRERLSFLHRLASKLAALKSSSVDVISNIDFIHSDLLTDFTNAIDLFNETFDDRDRRWALAVDELEIAPEFIQRSLFDALRSTDHRILIKLAISPYSANASALYRDPAAPQPGNDVTEIPLWYPRQDEAVEFGKRLFLSVVGRDSRFGGLTTEQILGHSLVGESGNAGGAQKQRYKRGGAIARAFVELATKDKSFAAYLANWNISPDALDPSDDSDNGPRIRKIAPLAAYRNYYFRGESDHRRPVFRSRKSAEFYTGSPSFFAVSEGNPRWLIGMTLDLLSRLPKESRAVPKSQQSIVIKATSDRFDAMLKTTPMDDTVHDGLQKSISSLMADMASYVREQTLFREFEDEPRCTFVVDEEVTPEIVSALQIALNTGAVVYMPRQAEAWSVAELRGKRLRLSYMLAPLHGLPVRAFKEGPLSRALHSRGPEAARLPGQTSLFTDS